MKLLMRFSNAKVQQVIARALVGSVLLILPACQIPALRQAESAPDLPAGFPGPANAQNGTTSAANSGQLSIEEFFNDPLLTRTIQQALAGNRELKILDEEVQIARSEILARQGAYLPFVTIGAGGGMNQYSRYTLEGASIRDDPYSNGRLLPNPLPNTQAGLNFSWQLDIWRQLRNARDAAKERYIAAAEKRNFFVTRLVAEVAENYYRLMALDKRIETLDKIIEFQEKSRDTAKAMMEAGKTKTGILPFQRFQAEVRKNQSEKLIIKQEIIEVENRINFLVNRYPAPVERMSGFLDLTINRLSVGVPSQLLQNRPDLRQAERELAAAGLDVTVARANFYPTVTITGGIGFEAFNPAYLFTNPAQALVAGVAGGLVAPLINKKAIQAAYISANAKQLESVYNYQRTVLNAFTEVVNRMSMVENYRKSIDLKKQQLTALEASVETASNLFLNTRVEYVEVLLAQRDLLDARLVLIDTKMQQLSAVVNAYQALGGGLIQAVPLSFPRELIGDVSPPS